MNRYLALIVVVLLVVPAVAIQLHMKYSVAVLVFGVTAAALAPIAIHKLPDARLAAGVLAILAFIASYPLRKMFNLNGFGSSVPVILAYCGVLFAVGFGWKRSWK